MRRLKLLTARTGPDIDDRPHDVIEVQSDEQADRMVEAQQAVDTSDPVTRPRQGRELKPTFRVMFDEVETAMLDTSGEGRKPPAKRKSEKAAQKKNNPRRGRRRKG